MFDENSFEQNSFSIDSWWFSIIELIKKKIKTLATMPRKYLVFPRFKIGG